MLSFIIGVIVTAIFYTFWPKAAIVSSNWLKALWAKHGAPNP